MFNKIIMAVPIIISSLSSHQSNDFYIKKFNELLKPYVLNENQDCYISSYQRIYFEDNSGYFFEFKNEHDKNIESLLVKGNIFNYKVEAIYPSNYKPFNEGEFYCFSPISFVKKEDFIIPAVLDYDWFGVEYNYLDIIKSELYFQYRDSKYNLIDTSDTDKEDKFINNVPNYINNQFIDKDGNANGCVPTVFAMYLAYLEDYCEPSICDNLNLPFAHINDSDKVEKFILNLGNKYFGTTLDGGTYRDKIPSAILKYMKFRNFDDYHAIVSKNFAELENSINNAQLPVPTSMKIYDNVNKEYNYHFVLTKGYKSYKEKNGERIDYVVANRASNSDMLTITFSVEYIRQFYFISRR